MTGGTGCWRVLRGRCVRRALLRGGASGHPAHAVQPPGPAALDYRAGTYSDLLESMIARLASRPELAGYTTRAPDDPGIAMLDCWALVGDIVTFYAERAVNEGYLGTATQPDSLTLLGRLVNYQPRPAVGASGYLAFTMDPGAAGVIPAGSQARSVAGPNELPQTFETSGTVPARSDWNQLAVRLTQPSALSADTADGASQLTLARRARRAARHPAGLRLRVGAVAGRAGRQHGHAGLRGRNHRRRPGARAGRADRRRGRPGPAQRTRRQRILRRAAARPGRPGGLRDPARVRRRGRFHRGLGPGRELTEALAIAAGRVPPAVASWLDRLVTPVLDQATTTLSLMAQDQRRLAPDLEYLQQLAQALTCPPSEFRREAARRAATGPCPW